MNAQLARTSPPAPFAPRLRPSDHLYRAAAVRVLAHRRTIAPDEILKTEFPEDKVTPLVLRSATTPATIGNAGWAGSLAVSAVSDAIVGLAGPSAAAELIARGLRVSLAGRSSITIPARLISPDDAGGFVAEGAPIQVRALGVSGGATLTPNKFAVIVAFTRELADRAVQDFETIVKQMLSEAAALALDAALFSATAGSEIRPPGILNGVAAITATAGGGQDALSVDISLLVGALSAAGAGKDVVFIAAPGQAASMKMWASARFDYPILASAALAAGTIIAIEASSFASAFSAVPEFLTSDETLIHMEDTTPLPISDPGAPNVVAAPTRSLFQTDCIAVRMILRCGWGIRAAGHVQVISGATW